MMASVPQMRLRPSTASGEAGAPAGPADADLFARLLAATPKGAAGEASLPDLATPDGGETATPEEGASPEELVSLLAPPAQPAAPLPQPAPRPVSSAEDPVAEAPVRGQQPPTVPIDQPPAFAPAVGPVPATVRSAPPEATVGIDSKAPAAPAPSSPPPVRAAKAVKSEATALVAAHETEIGIEGEAKPAPPVGHAKATAEVRPEVSPLRPVVGTDRGQTRAPAPAKTMATRTVERAAAPAVEMAPPPAATAAPASPMPQAQPFRAEAAPGELPAPATAPAGEGELDLQNDAEWLDRLARDIARAGDGTAPLRFRLHPQTLGHLGVELVQTEQGTHVRLTADTEAARALIADAQPRLLAEARAQGVRIAEAQVDLAGSGGRDGADPRRHDEPRTPSARGRATAAGDAPTDPHESSDRFA